MEELPILINLKVWIMCGITWVMNVKPNKAVKIMIPNSQSITILFISWETMNLQCQDYWWNSLQDTALWVTVCVMNSSEIDIRPIYDPIIMTNEWYYEVKLRPCL